jgi:hypothetical protein
MGNTLTGQIVAETYEALLKVTDNGIITGTKKRITDGFGNDTPLLLSSTDVQIDGNFLLPGTTLQYVRGDGSLATFPTIISTLTTTGSSGASTLIGSTLNIPNYTLTGLGGVPTSRTLTINGTTFDLSANRSWTITDTGLTSVGISMPSAFTVSNSPLTANGTIAITGAGLASQYIRGDGTLANFPTSSGGGSSVSYYLNGSINQGTILGNVYRELNKTPIIGAGTDFTISSNGYIAQFITDANDPALLEIPGGNWNFEMFFSASSGGGSPSFYVELYKYDGTAFTLIASDSATPEGITNGTAIDLYTTALAVPQTTLTLTDRLAIRVYVTNSGRTITLHTENGHLCQVITTFSSGINALNSLTKQVQYFAVGTSGTDFAISSATDTHTFNLPTASGTNRGALSSADWTTFNSKVPSTRTLTINGTAYDLSADRSWTIASGVSGSGTTNYVPKFTGSSAIGNSLIFDNGTNVGIGTASPGAKLDVVGNIANRIGNSYYTYTDNYGFGTPDSSGLQIFAGTSDSIRFGRRTSGTTFTERMRIDSDNGNVGIGTSSPTQKLDVNGNAVVLGFLQAGDASILGAPSYGLIPTAIIGKSPAGVLDIRNTNGTVNAGDTAGIIQFSVKGDATPGYTVARIDVSTQINTTTGNSGGGNMKFLTSGGGTGAFPTERMRITNTGNVGIGTSSPAQKLDVTGNISTTGSTIYSDGGGNVMLAGRDFDFYGVANSDGGLFVYGNNKLHLSTNSVRRLSVDGSGNVGIGTTSPIDKLTVSGRVNVLGTSQNSIWLNQSAGGSSNGYIVGRSFSSDDAQNFFIYDALAAAFRLNITSTGNVGIGTTSPSVLLDLFKATYPVLQISSGTVTGNIGIDTASNFVNVGASSNHPLAFSTNNTERMRITSGGNVYIGTTSAPGILGVNGNGASNYAASISNTVANNNVLLLSGTSDSTSQNKVVFANGGTVTGTIFTTATTTTYNITSDYRLKEDLKEINGLEKLLKLKVYDFKWKDSEDRMDGVLAHELQEVIPYAVAGEKDGENMQGVDYSKIVPILVKAIQEQQIQIEELKAKLK